MSQTKLTYLLGAGASAQAVPVVSQLYDRMEFFIEEFSPNNIYFQAFLEFIEHEVSKHPFSDKELNDSDIETYQKKFDGIILKLKDSNKRKLIYGRFSQLLEMARNHYSIDTFSKMLFLQDQVEYYEKCKDLISLYLFYEQLDYKPDLQFIEIALRKKNKEFEKSIDIQKQVGEVIDKRYDQLMAAILKKNKAKGIPIFPRNLNILSWNYDLQIEQSLKRFSNHKYISKVRDNYFIYPRGPKFEPTEILLRDSRIIKINGSCGMIKDKSGLYFTESNQKSIIYGFLGILDKWMDPQKKDFQNTESSISFAWEDGDLSPTSIIKRGSEILFNSSSIVIIGYSFPVFNREIDKQLFSQLREGTKIYIQDLPGNIKSVIHAAESIIPEGIEPIPIDKVDQFYVPFEFVPEYC